MFKPYFVRNFVLPLYNVYKQEDRSAEYYSKYKRLQWCHDELMEFQERSLYSLLKYAVNNVPYYRMLYREKKISLNKHSVYDNLHKFPPMDRQKIKKFFPILCNPTKKHWVNTTSGSTGEPVKILQDWKHASHALALERLHFEWAGQEIGKPIVRLVGGSIHKKPLLIDMRERFFRWIKSDQILSVHSLNSVTT